MSKYLMAVVHRLYRIADLCRHITSLTPTINYLSDGMVSHAHCKSRPVPFELVVSYPTQIINYYSFTKLPTQLEPNPMKYN